MKDSGDFNDVLIHAIYREPRQASDDELACPLFSAWTALSREQEERVQPFMDAECNPAGGFLSVMFEDEVGNIYEILDRWFSPPKAH